MQLGPYEVTGQLGRGAMGIVFEGRSPDGQSVAIKILIDRAKRERFLRELRLSEMLGAQDGFVPFIDSGDSAQGPYLVMPLLRGGTLGQKLRIKEKLDSTEVVELGIALARAMARAHERGIIHRDLKPENILYDGDRPLIADLGMAKHFDDDAKGASASVVLSKTGEVRGTVSYMAPEQVRDSKHAGPASDVYAIGAILYECLSGRAAFTGDGIIEVIQKIASGDYLRLRAARPDAPAWLAAVIERAMSIDLETRYPDARALLQALEKGAARANRRRAPAVAIAIAVAIIAALAVGSVAFARSKSGPVTPPSPPTPPPPPPPPVAKEEPKLPPWWTSVPAAERPPVPLPEGLEFSDAKREYRWTRDGSILLWVPPARFQMGSSEWGPVHSVEVSGYFLGKLELTNAQFEAFQKAKSYKTTAEELGTGDSLYNKDQAGATWRYPNDIGHPVEARHPVVQVSWVDAQEYCKWAGLRLPTEAEWERAAAWGPPLGSRQYSWGNMDPEQTKAKVANLADRTFNAGLEAPWMNPWYERYTDGFVLTAPVGSFPDGASPVGALDMTGNVHEWCQDGFDEAWYKKSPAKDPVCATGEERVFRGGSFDSMPMMSRTTSRNHARPEYRRSSLGFRVAR